ncbi:nidogen-1 isoform X2 [Oryzias latipes]|uniref:nidogen-1 isoform X2 n=1 Tax=Oryzias latipes TaxID=8090 RepID=UPI0009D9A931|nr:nidogen-1 isoform X2 [Oryzias latipes]
MGLVSRTCAWLLPCLLGWSAVALELRELFEFGEEAGDRQLPQTPDASVEVLLNHSVRFFQDAFHKVYINTNGFLAFENPPPEQEYLGKMPSPFKMIAALLGDLDSGGGLGRVHFREDDSPEVLRRAGERIRLAFPTGEEEEPTNALIVTWENMVAQGTLGRGDGLFAKRNTFQLVVASTESVSYAILLYPRGGLQFFSTSVGGERTLLEAGFNEGLVKGWIWSSQGLYVRTTTDDETSIMELATMTNSAKNGIWVYKIGALSGFTVIIPGLASSSPEDRQMNELQELDLSTFESETINTTEEEFPTATTTEYKHLEVTTISPESTKLQTQTPNYKDHVEQEDPDSDPVAPTYSSPEGQPEDPEKTATENPTHQTLTQKQIIPEPIIPSPDSDPVQHRYTNLDSVQPESPHSPHQYPQVVVIDEDEDLNVDVFGYNLDTCIHNRHRCSAFAECRDYRDGYCCHCRPGFYGNGKDCVAEGKPQRMNGKVNGQVYVGNSQNPVELNNNDLHSYVVANDGRAYIAISHIPDSVGPSLQPLSSVGGVIGWAFALQQPGYKNGFSLIGGVFSRFAEVIFHPGNERLTIKQEFEGIDEHDHLVLNTKLDGHVPVIPPKNSVEIKPYKEVYQYSRNLITSSSTRNYTIISPDGSVQTRSYYWRQTITFKSCPHQETTGEVPPIQQLSVDQIFVMFDSQNHLMRFAMTNKIGSIHSDPSEQNPCFTGGHDCDINAVCRAAEGSQFSCECTAGFSGDGHLCDDIDECQYTSRLCGPNAVCFNQPGSFRCECSPGFVFAADRKTCIEEQRPVDHCRRESHDCDVPERAMCSYTGGSAYMCSCLSGFEGDGRRCQDVDECLQEPCHRDALCSNTQGSYSCQCRPGFHGDGFRCSPASTEREKTPCELQRQNAQTAAPSGSGFLSFFRPRPVVAQYVPQCDQHGAYEPTQCHSSIGQCWCVDANGQEIPDTRTGAVNTALCINQAVTPAPGGPTPRPDIHPISPGTHLVFAQSGKIEHVPLDGYKIKTEEARPLLHIPDRVVIAVAFDCVERMVYWTDITGPAISKASLSGGDIIPVVTKELQSPEGIAVDDVARLLFWTDSMRDTIEVSKLDGSQRLVLFDTDLVNPRPIVTNPAYGRIYWADWDRDGPKIEMSNMDGTERSVLVEEDLGLPNGLTLDADNQQLCWADAGTQRVECMDLHRRLRRQIVEGIQYPFALVSFGKNLYYTDWKREAVVAVDRHTQTETDEFLPQKRSRLYGITTTPTQCSQVFNYCSNNGGCSHLCLPRLGGFTCRCPDVHASRCVEAFP